MDGMGMQLLTMVGYQVPEAIAALVALALLWTSAQPGPARSKGIAGIGLVLFSVICRFAVSVLQTWMLQQRDTVLDMQHFFAAMGIAGMLLNLLSAVGLVLIVWGLCQATRPAAHPEQIQGDRHTP
ncbi:hypothetical protein [Pseudoxanthomonas wuyuanensis]